MLNVETEESVKVKGGKILVILNPIAGKGKAIKEYPKIEAFLKNHKQDYEIILTKGPRDAIDIVRDYPLDRDTVVVAAGGDGTSNEVVNGLLTRKERLPEPPLFGLLPIGRGNDFACSAQVSPDPDAALEILLKRNTMPLDVGFVRGGYFPEGRYFVNGLGIGFDTKVGLEAAKMKIHSALSYVFGAIITLIRYEASPLLEIKYDGKTLTEEAILASFMNGRRMGGSFFMGPKAVLNDGLLDICVVSHRNRRKIFQIILHYTKGTQEECDGVTMTRAADITLKALQGGITAHCDGETVCLDGKELNIICRPQVLNLICP
jgi:YegS/Rv2252/BmrU family lipid kinase